VVRLRRLWPRSSAQPPLTRADRRAYRAYAKTTMRRPSDEMAVNVQFSAAVVDPSEKPEVGKAEIETPPAERPTAEAAPGPGLD